MEILNDVFFVHILMVINEEMFVSIPPATQYKTYLLGAFLMNVTFLSTLMTFIILSHKWLLGHFH